MSLCSSVRCTGDGDGAVSRDDSKFYCRKCWRGFPLSSRSACVVCSQTRWGHGSRPADFCCSACLHELSNIGTAKRKGSCCRQCLQWSTDGFPSQRERGAFYCASCWKAPTAAASTDRKPCTLCDRMLGGYYYAVPTAGQEKGPPPLAGATKLAFLCQSCISVFEQRRELELRMQRQKEDDLALLTQEISTEERLQRSGCKYIDDALLKVLLALQQTPQSITDAQDVLRDVQGALSAVGLACDVYGSRRTGLAVTNSDVDFFVRMPTAAAVQTNSQDADDCSQRAFSMRKKIDLTAAALREYKATDGGDDKKTVFASVAVINARVPLVSCVHASTGIMCDLSFTPIGILGTKFLCAQLKHTACQAGRQLIVLIKLFLQAHGLGDANSGGLGSFAIAMMVLWFLRERRSRSSTFSIGVLLQEFLSYFGNDFDSKSRGIDVLEHKIVAQKSKYCKSPGGICVRHPIERDANAANGCDKFQSVIRPLFSNAAMALDHLSRMTFVMKTGDIFQAASDLVLHPLANAAPKRVSATDCVALRPQHEWCAEGNVYSGGLSLTYSSPPGDSDA